MKLDIKSFLIGVLATINLFMLYGFTTADSDDNLGRYNILYTALYGGMYIWYDTTSGELITTTTPKQMGKWIDKNITDFDSVYKKIEDAEQD